METFLDTVLAAGAILGSDVVRLAHLLAISVGLGTMVATDIGTLRRVERAVDGEYCRAVENAHRLMMPALMLAWASGIVLIGMRTGFDLNAFSPKLWAKLVVVTTLTLTAFVVQWQVMPIIHRAKGATLMEVGLRDKLVLAVCAGLSMSGWTTALVLGASQFFKTAGWVTVISLLAVIYVVAIATALRVALVLHTKVEIAISQTRRIAAE